LSTGDPECRDDRGFSANSSVFHITFDKLGQPGVTKLYFEQCIRDRRQNADNVAFGTFAIGNQCMVTEIRKYVVIQWPTKHY